MTDPTKRFSGRVAHYIRSRPGYPPQVIATLRDECDLTSDSLIADVGSGTGLLSQLFLENGNEVFAIEPNPEMRAAGERLLGEYTGFHSETGTAESTNLPDECVDFVAAGQAFHWFDRQKARREFERILKPHGWVALVWNDRDLDSTPFMRAYEALLRRYGTDYDEVDHKVDGESLLEEFFGASEMRSAAFPNRQEFDYSGLEARVLSTSYVPGPDHPEFDLMISGLVEIFEGHQSDGRVHFEYVTRLYFGRLD